MFFHRRGKSHAAINGQKLWAAFGILVIFFKPDKTQNKVFLEVSSLVAHKRALLTFNTLLNCTHVL